MKTNKPNISTSVTHEGGKAFVGKPIDQLRRSVLSCLLWEDTFYEDGVTIADRISDLVAKCSAEDVEQIILDAKVEQKLRHVPLYLICCFLKQRHKRPFFWQIIDRCLTRPDDVTELLSLYWKDGKKPIPAAMKKGMAKAFGKFDAYQLAKYNRDEKIKLKDVLFLCHGKPGNEEFAAIWKKLIDGTLESPDTWEVALSQGDNKKETFERLLKENKLGYLALLRNLRNMMEAKCDESLVRQKLLSPSKGILPFQFLSAMKHAKMFAGELNQAMLSSLNGVPKMLGSTVILVDCSGSMNCPLSAKSELMRADVAIGLAILGRELCQQCRVFAFASLLTEVPPWNGMALGDAIRQAHVGGGTYLWTAVNWLMSNIKDLKRLIVITDEQSADSASGQWPKDTKLYTMNVGTYEHGINTTANCTRISGFSEHVFRYIMEKEKFKEE